MTVTATSRKNQFTTNGVTTEFTFDFAITDTSQVYAFTVVDGVETEYTDFTVEKSDDVEGGILTTGTALSGVDLLIYRDVALTQQVDYESGGKFPADSHEQALDKLTLQNQDQQEELDRTLKSSISNATPYTIGPLDDGKLIALSGSELVSVEATIDDAEMLNEYVDFAEEWADGDELVATTPDGKDVRTIAGANSDIDDAITRLEVGTLVASHELESTEFLINTFDGSELLEGDAIKTLGYYSKGDGGGGLFLKVSGSDTPSQDMGYFSSNEITDTAGNKYEIQHLGVFNVKEWGAKGDGITNTSPYLQAIYNSMRNNKINEVNGSEVYGGDMYFPPGDYVVNELVGGSETTNRTVYHGLKGFSRDDCRVLVSNPDGFLKITKSNYRLLVNVRDISIMAANSSLNGLEGVNSGTALHYEQGDTGNRRDRHLTMSNVYIGTINASTPVDDHFDYGIRVIGGGRAMLTDVYTWGINSTNREREDTWIGSTGFDFFNHYGPTLNTCGSWGYKTGCSYDTDTDPGPEGGSFIRCTFDAETGLYVRSESSGGEPSLTIDNVHCNYGLYGYRIINKRLCRIYNSVLYNETDETYGNAIDISLENVNTSFVDNVMFHYSDRDSRINVSCNDDCYDLKFTNLTHNAGVGYNVGALSGEVNIVNPEFTKDTYDRYQLNDNLNVNISTTHERGLTYYMDSDVAIDSGVASQLVWTATESDPIGWVTLPWSSLTVPANAGIKKIRVSSQINWSISGSGNVELWATKNASSFTGQPWIKVPLSENSKVSICSSVIPVEDGDTIRIFVRQSTGSQQSILAGSHVQIEVIN